MADKLDELIARLEKATGPDRGLDADVCEAVYGVTVDRSQPLRPGVWAPQHICQGGEIQEIDAWSEVPLFSASLDAALTLVPVDADWEICYRDEGDPDKWYDALVGEHLVQSKASPALALCIAALRARTTGRDHG